MFAARLLNYLVVALVFTLTKQLYLEVLADGPISSTIQREAIETVDETINEDIELQELVSGKLKGEENFEVKNAADVGSSVESTANNNRRILKQEHLDTRRIVGGDNARIEIFPYVASILVNDEHWCNGVIITEYLVITAAHCTNFVLPVSNDPVVLSRRLKVRTSTTAVGGGRVTPVRNVIRHPLFELQPPPHYDIALLELSEDLEIKDNVTTSVAKIQLAEDILAPFPQTFVVVCGWGAIKPSTSDRSSWMQSARLKIRTHEYCVNSYQDVAGLFINQNFVCASLLRNATSKRDMCIFDGGAPAVQGNKLVGVMSFGPENCAEGPPAVFVRISPLVPWITAEVDKLETIRHKKTFIG